MEQKVTIQMISNAARTSWQAIFPFSALVVLLLFAYATEHQAQIRDPQMTKLSGVVIDDHCAGLGRVEITAKKNGKIIARAKTEVDGKYELDLMPGVYSLEFKLFPFIPFEVPRYVVPIGAKFWKLDVCLECEDCGERLYLPGT